MPKYYGKFDAKAYWATKPLCLVCKSHKVKNGTVCYQCKKTKEQVASSQTKKVEPANTKPQEPEEVEREQKVSQIKFDRNFIKRLLEKLKVGNTRSIHLNAIPGSYATRLDLSQLSHVDKKIPNDFIETILSNDSSSFVVSYDKIDLGDIDEEEKKKLALISKRLNTLVIENTDNFLEFGLKNFGFGYPILIKRDRNDPEKIIKAPLFIWHLDIERSYRNKNTWIIKKDEDSPIKINELLISHLVKDESVKIEKISKEILEDGVLDKDELLELTQNILSQLNTDTENLELKLEKCPDAKQIEAIANSKPWIQWSGIFGIYRSQNETIIHATEELLERFDEFESENLILEQFQTSSISAVETDPSKEEIVNTLTKDEIKLIQGPPGTGKSQSITAIVSNALANNAKCLIVCEKKTALDVIQANLANIGLSNFAVVIDDVNKDRKKLIEKARNIKDSSYYAQFSKLNFDEKYKKFCQLKKEINVKHAESLKRVFGDFSWKQLIGLYLRHSKSGYVAQVEQELDYKNLKFNHEEYSGFYTAVEEASFLYGDLAKDSEEIFSELNNDIFSKEYKWAKHGEIKIETAEFVKILKELNIFLSEKSEADYAIKGVSIFSPESVEKSENLIEKIIETLKTLISLYEKGSKLAGKQYDDITFLQNFKYNFLSVFSAKNKDINSTRRRIPELSVSLIRDIQNFNKFDFEGLSIKKFEEYQSLSELKDDCKSSLEKAEAIRKSIQKLKNISKDIESFEKRLSKIEKNGLFDFKLKNYAELKTFEKVTKLYSTIEEKIRRLEENLDSYESYHYWRFFCSSKNKFELQIFLALKKFETENWKNIFIAWYYRGALLNFEANTENGFHKSDSKLQQLSTLYSELEKQQIQQIKSIWGSNRSNQLSKASFNFNTLYNLRKNNAGPKNSLRKIIEKDFELFTSLFPVILTNPVAANAILPLEQGLFNIVIFDEASQLKISDTFTCLIRGQYKIIAGDEHQMPPSNYFQSNAELLETDDEEDDDAFSEADEQAVLAEAESLLQYASDLQNINKSYLDFHYRSKHPALIDFSNNAFYGGNLIPFPAQEVYKPIEFRAVNGRYETRTNPTEVAEILKIIENEIHPDHNGKYPSIGIATFNINQRNLITEALNASAENSTAFANKLQELRERGLFVKNLENIQGDEKDIIIISTTYGIKPDGKFSQSFARLNRIEGYKLLNVLITRAKDKLYVCTSIPREKYLAYQEDIKNEGNNKKGILYAYLAYAEAVSNNEPDLAESILKTLKEQSFEKPRAASGSDGLSESPFEEEVNDLLVDEFGEENVVQQHRIGGFRLDFIIKTKTKDIVLECDGKAYHSSEEAYAYDMYRQKELENMGFLVYRIWSTNWFQDKESEMKKLKMFVETV
jgi:very-short-patch-repair endonuclease